MTDNKDTQGIPNRVRYLLAAVLICSALVLGIIAPVDAAEISTDLGDYAPWETVYISGEGFTPGAPVTMTVEWPAPDSGTYEVIPAATADSAGRIAAEYSLTSWPNGCGLEGVYRVVAVDSVTGDRATTTFTDAYNPPAGQHWVVFENAGLPSGTVVHVTIDGYITEQLNGPWVYSSRTGFPIEVNPRKIVRTEQGKPFTYRDYSALVSDPNGNIYTFDSVSESGPVFVGSGGSYSYVTFTFKKLDEQPANSVPSLATVHDALTVNEGTIAENSGTWSDANSGDLVTLSATSGTVTKNGVNAGGTWSWSCSTTDGQAQSGTVTITANDGKGGVTSTSFSLTVKNVAPTPIIGGAPTTSPEGTTISLAASATDPSPDDSNAGFTYAWSVTKDGVSCGSGETGSYSFTPDDDATYVVTLKARDKDGGEGTATASIEVTNIAPRVIGPIAVPSDPVRVGTSMSTSASFTDPGTADTHTVLWTWDDDSTSAGVITQSGGSGSMGGSHTYTAAGVYTVRVQVTDKDGGVDDLSASTPVVVYDPSAGFATGGGWFVSPADAYAAENGLTGKANFGFVSKYKKGSTVPECSLEFQFKPGNLNFKSSGCEYLVIAGSTATFKGTGTVNGAGNYGFLLSVKEGSPDTLEMKIWDKNRGDVVVYDNHGTPVDGGNIVIHK